MDLIDAGERRAGQDRVGGEAAVGLDGLRIVAAAQPAIEAGDRARRNAARAAEKSVRHAVERRRPDDVEAHNFSLMTMSSSAWLPTMKA